MSAFVAAALLAAFLSGVLVRGRFAAVERRKWGKARQAALRHHKRLRARLTVLQGQLDEAVAADYLPRCLGDDLWLYDALAAACAEVRPGERAENLTIQTRWRDTADVVLIGIDRGNQVAERAMRLHVSGGCGRATEDVDLPPPDSPDWLTG